MEDLSTRTRSELYFSGTSMEKSEVLGEHPRGNECKDVVQGHKRRKHRTQNFLSTVCYERMGKIMY